MLGRFSGALSCDRKGCGVPPKRRAEWLSQLDVTPATIGDRSCRCHAYFHIFIGLPSFFIFLIRALLLKMRSA